MAKKQTTSDEDEVKAARDAFQSVQDHENDNRKTALEDIRFVRLQEHWPDDIRAQRERDGRPCLTIDKLGPVVRQVVNDARQNKPSIKTHPVDSRADRKTAEIIDGLIRNIEYTSNADVAYDTAVECAVSGGFGYWRVGMDFARDDSFDMDISILRVANPFSVYGDPASMAADSSDWDVAFVTDILSKDQFEEQWGDKAKVSWDDTAWTDAGASWKENERVTIAEYWTREKVDKVIYLLSDGTVVDDTLLQDEDVAFRIQTQQVQIVDQRMTKSHKVTQRIMSGVEILETRDWPGRYIPIVPVYGEEFNIEGKRYFRSMIHAAKDAQRMFNYWRTTGTELVALAPRVPFIGPKGSFDSDMERWNTVNTQNHPFLEYDVTGAGVAPQRQPLDMGVAAGAMQEALNASDDIKAITGLYDASLGARSNETSGRAIMARQREGDVSTFHFIDNMARAIRHTGRIIIDLIPHVYDRERIVRVTGEDGGQNAVQINAPVQQVDPQTGQPMVDEMGQAVTAIHDLRVGKYDVVVETGPSFTTRREEAAAQMTELIRAFPAAAPIVGPELAKNLDWPGADKIAEKMEAQQSGQVPPEAQKAMQEMQAQLQQLAQENQQLKQDKSEKIAEVQADFQIEQVKLANEKEIARLKIAADQQTEFYKAQANRDATLLQNGGIEEDGPDGQKIVRGGTEVVMRGLTALGEGVSQLGALVQQQGEANRSMLEQVARIVAAPNELIRDPKTGRASGSRKVMQ